MREKEAAYFAEQWIAAWNSHDLDAILEHYAEDLEMTTPFILELTKDSTGTLKGKDKVREYFKQALQKVPDINFRLIEVLWSVNSLVIYYHAVFGRRAAEVLIFNADGKVMKSIAHYNQ